MINHFIVSLYGRPGGPVYNPLQQEPSVRPDLRPVLQRLRGGTDDSAWAFAAGGTKIVWGSLLEPELLRYDRRVTYDITSFQSLAGVELVQQVLQTGPALTSPFARHADLARVYRSDILQDRAAAVLALLVRELSDV